MAKRRMDVDRRSNTLEENKLVLHDLRTRNKIEHRSPQELNKLFAKLNTDASSKYSKNAKISGTRQEKTITEHPYGPLEGFPVGSWWGIRMDCSRDRVHDPFDADVQEGRYGAVSLCTSHLTTADVDLGDSLTFTGGKYESSVKSDEPLLRSYKTQVPLRLVRSYNLTNIYAPKTGYRYDGLYTVAAHWIGVTSDDEEHYKFALVRVRDQEPSVWHVTNRLSGKLSRSSQKSLGPRTRCNERLSTNLCGETTRVANDQETTNGSRSRNETTKYSFDKSSFASGTEKSTIECKKISHDSAIVTRCIFNKKIECSPNVAQSSVSTFVESPINETACKLQNTNISIRTDLYESYLHQEPVKVTPMTFCRTYKSSRGPTHIVKHSNVGTLNLNSCGPCPRDKEQESQIQSRSGIAKFSSTQSPCSETNRSGDRSTPKIRATTATPTNATNSVVDESVDLPKPSIDERSKVKRPEAKRRDAKNSPERTPNSVARSTDGTFEKIETVCPITRTKSKESVEAAAIKRDESSAKETSKESHGALDSLAPDQMLNFIVEQKYHPRAKLLIGSVIGLATGESTILRAYDSLISRQKRWNQSQSLHSTEVDSSANLDGTNASSAGSSFECRQGAIRESRKNERCAPKTITKKRTINEQMLKMRLRRTRVSKRSQGKDKKSLTKPSESTSQRLGKSMITDKSQQAFSKSTTLKKSKKRAKKRGGELARLVIDANVGPKIRGPRNRRLRGTTNIFAMRCATRQQSVSTCCGGKNSDVGPREKKGNTRVELTSRRSKRLISAAKTSITQSHYMERKEIVPKNERIPRSRYADSKNTNETPERMNLERRYKKETGNNLKARGTNTEACSVNPSSEGAKRKMPRTRSGSRERSSGSRDESTKRLCCNTRNVTKTRTNRMVDAATQCSDRRDAATSVERDIEHVEQQENHENSMKVEWINLDDVKSETHESLDEESSDIDNERIHCGAIGNTREDTGTLTRPINVVPIRPQATKPRIDVAPRLSAFVPVNLSDSDFRIARLRSIGFRPIEPVIFSSDKDPLHGAAGCEQNTASGSSNVTENPTVASRIVDEQYNKYTSEETDVVEYMDHELRFQDIEEEEVAAVRKNRGKMSKKGPKTARNKKYEAAKGETIQTVKGQRASGCIEDDSDAPWHGWKKFMKNKQAHWTGW